jgi:hypothetical protein
MAAARPPPTAPIEQAEGIAGFGPAADARRLAAQIEGWVTASGLSVADIRIEYGYAKAFFSPFTLAMHEGHTALVIWLRPS